MTETPVKEPTAIQQRAQGERALELALAGATYQKIAEQLGYSSRAAAYRSVKRALDRNAPDPRAVDELRAKEAARLDRLQQAHWVSALNGSTEATHMVLKIMDRRARLLGLYAPIKVDTRHTVGSELDQEIEQLMAELPAKADG